MKKRTNNEIKIGDIFALGLVALYDSLPVLILIGLMVLPGVVSN